MALYLHGGGWAMLDLDTHDHVLRALAAESGWAVVGLDYPLAPGTQFPDTPRLVAAALAEPAAAWNRVALAGDSAGANLALVAAALGPARPAALLLAYGVWDSDLGRPSSRAFGRPPLLLSPERMAMFWDLYCPDPKRRRDPLAAPLRLASERLTVLPPTWLLIAGLDVLADENRAMAVRLRAAGVEVDMDEQGAAPHGFLEALSR